MKNLFIICALALTSCSQAQTTIGLNLSKGETYTQKMNSQMRIDQEVQGQSMTIDMSIGGQTNYTVTAIKDDVYTMTVEYKRLAMSMNTPMGEMAFDSDGDDDNIFSSIFKTLINKPFIIDMNSRGKVLNVSGLDGLFDDAFDQFSDLNPAQIAQIKDQLTEAYGEDAFKGNIEMVSYIFPEDAVNVGDQWNIGTDLRAGMHGRMDTEYTLKELKDETAIINGESTIKTDPDKILSQGDGMQMQYDMNGTMSTEILVDRKSGWIISASIAQTLTGESKILSSPQVPGGMTLPMKMSSTMEISQ